MLQPPAPWQAGGTRENQYPAAAVLVDSSIAELSDVTGAGVVSGVQASKQVTLLITQLLMQLTSDPQAALQLVSVVEQAD